MTREEGDRIAAMVLILCQHLYEKAYGRRWAWRPLEPTGIYVDRDVHNVVYGRSA